MENLINVENLRYQIPGGHLILDNISFEVVPGKFLGILGRNGVGKTTLMDLLMGMRDHTDGEVSVLGLPPAHDNRHDFNRISFLSQDICLKGDLTIGKFLTFHASFYPSYSHDEESRLLQYFGLDRRTKLGALSTGQQKKVQIIAGLAAMPKLLLIDEITAVLDPETRMQFFELLTEFKTKHNVAILLATNIAEDLTARCDEILFINDTLGSLHKPSEIGALFNLGGEDE